MSDQLQQMAAQQQPQANPQGPGQQLADPMLMLQRFGSPQGSPGSLPTGQGSPLARFGVNSPVQAPGFDFNKLAGIIPYLQSGLGMMQPQKSLIPAPNAPPQMPWSFQQRPGMAPLPQQQMQWGQNARPGVGLGNNVGQTGQNWGN